MQNQYIYDGPVMEFGKCIDDHWKGVTWAVSEEKARSNLAYQYKKAHNRIPASKVDLPGEIEMVS